MGAAIALNLAQAGHDVAITGTRRDALAATTGTLHGAGARVLALDLDLRSQASIEAAFAGVLREFGELDVLVNNAGITTRSLAVDTTREEWRAIIDVNVSGTFFMCQQMGRHRIACEGGGVIINLGSTHGMVGFAQRSAYGVSKAAISQMTRMLAIEWAEHRIRVNAVAPGTVATPSRVAYFGADPRGFADMIARVPLKRLCEMDEVAAAVAYLASPAAAYITGQTLMLDGGLTSY
jgi:2-deoxy-D-gluconate 3-dehydrogenase